MFKVDERVVGDDFTKARRQALLDACVTWNAIDKSARYRIKLPETKGSCPDYQLANKDMTDDSAGESSGGESDAHSEE